jgi:transposase InsO family protein
MRRTLETEIVTAALEMAIGRRRPQPGLGHHSDHGSQYTSFAFGHRCREAGIAPSMGEVGSAYDNAMAESFFASLECELLETREQARSAAFDYLGDLVQPTPPAFLARVRLAGGVRKEVRRAGDHLMVEAPRNRGNFTSEGERLVADTCTRPRWHRVLIASVTWRDDLT